MLQSLFLAAQGDGILRTAFRDSYTQEYAKNYADAIAALNKVYTESSYEMNLRMGWLHYNNKNYTVSESYYSKAVNLKPDAVEAKMGLIMPLVFLESWDKVLKQYEDILKMDPLNSTANYWAGTIYYNRKKYEMASKYFEKVVKLYPFAYDANHMLGWSYLNLGKLQEAKALFTKVLLISPDDSSAQQGLGKIK
ncbi:MAG TPA: tetratricopeptide repeat protein [Segetibacter sp.]